MVADDRVPTVQELAAMPYEERLQYFLDHPMDGQDADADPGLVARARAHVIPIIAQRDAEQAADRHAS
jgi:hypothetical protein